MRKAQSGLIAQNGGPPWGVLRVVASAASAGAALVAALATTRRTSIGRSPGGGQCGIRRRGTGWSRHPGGLVGGPFHGGAPFDLEPGPSTGGFPVCLPHPPPPPPPAALANRLRGHRRLSGPGGP